MSGLNNDDDDALDNVDSLISKIKGNTKIEEIQKHKDTADLLKTPSNGDRSPSNIGDFEALRKKMEASDKGEPELSVSKPSDPERAKASTPTHDDLEFSDIDPGDKKTREDTVIEIIDEDPKGSRPGKIHKKSDITFSASRRTGD